MVEMYADYKGELRCELTHKPSGTRVMNDAPTDNMGRGESFSPTDMMGAALASCALITMGIYGRKNGIEFSGATARVSKEMTSSPPRRIARLPLEITMPAGISPELRQKLEAAAEGCPARRSLHPDIEAPVQFIYPD